MKRRKIHFAATEPLSESDGAKVIDSNVAEIPQPGAVGATGEAATQPAVSPESGEVKPQRKSQKRCVVCKRGVENCECKGGPLTREEYEAVIASRSGESGKTKKKERNPQSVEDMARTLLFFYSKGGSWLSALACRVSPKKTDAIWAISEDQCAKILPPSITVLEKYWDDLPSWLTFLQEHMAEFMLAKVFVEMTVENVHATIDLRRELRRASQVPSSSIPKGKANGAEKEASETVM